MQYQSYHELLSDELERRKQINAAYSLRAFARDLKISAQRLSQVINGKHGLSLVAAQTMAKQLKLSVDEAKWFCDSVGSLHARNSKERSSYQDKITQYKEKSKPFTQLSLEYFKVISDWYHFAILELTYLKNFKNDPIWIAKTLEIKPLEVIEAIERMKNLDLIKEVKGQLIDVFKFLETGNDTPSSSLKKFHSQLLQRAQSALFNQDVEQREFGSNIISINKKSLPDLKEKIRTFRQEIETLASKQKNKDSVYCLGIQFHELTKGDL